MAAVLALQAPASAQQLPLPPDPSQAWIYEALLNGPLELRPAEYDIIRHKKIALTTPDQHKLVADIYRPAKPTPSPTILIRIPLDDNATGGLFSEILGRIWASRGYNVMIQGVRGRFGSSGEHIPFQTETADGLATVRWLRQQSWHDGKVGMWGGSYFGHTQWALADRQEAADLGLSALFIQIASTDHHDTFHPGGALAYETVLYWASRSHSGSDTPFSHERMLQAMQAGPVLEADKRIVGKPIPFYRDWVQHTQRDAFWKQADGEGRAARLQVPTLLMAGWYDPFLPSQLRDYKNIQQQGSPRMAYASRLILGPWSHAETMRMPDGYMDLHYRLASLKPALDWYDQHLLGRRPHRQPPVQIFVSGINQWRAEQEWPLARTRYTPIYLASGGHANSLAGDGRLSFIPPSPSSDRFVHDPNHPVPSEGGAILLGQRSGPWEQTAVEKRQDVLVYTSEPLKENLEVVGELHAKLNVSTSAPNTDFVVKLADVHPDGKSYALSQGILRRDYKTGIRQAIDIELWPIGHVFLKGHCLRVEVASSHFPMFDVNPNTGEDVSTGLGMRPVQQSLYTGHGQLSQLMIPLIPHLSKFN